MTKLSLVMALICMAAVLSYSLGSRENDDKKNTAEITRGIKNGAVVIIEGRVRLVGNEPFSELIITDDKDIQWYIDEEGQVLLRDFEQRRIRVQGTAERKEMKLANGKMLPDRFYLHDLVILE